MSKEDKSHEPVPVISLKGVWHMQLFGPDGKLKDERRDSMNVITTNGKEFLASFLKSSVASGITWPMKFIAIGTGTNAENASDSALQTEAARNTGTVTYTSGAIYEVVASFPAGTGTGAITEYGLLSTASAGTLFSRDTESAINKGASDSLVVTTQITFS